MGLIKTFKQACKKIGVDPAKALPDVSVFPEQHQKALIATAKLIIINDALNRDENNQPWKPDWNNYDEYKYYPWFYLNSPGFRFDVTVYVLAVSSVGSRLCYRTRALAKHAGETFIDLYKDLMVI
ncbi:MAG: hypothetical protein QM802_20075 [Agriterribacter sp.]